MDDKLFEGLTEEQIAKARQCKNSEELLLLAKAEGIQLNDEQLAAVSGGGCLVTTVTLKCKKCGGKLFHNTGPSGKHLRCNNCGEHVYKDW